MDRSTELADLLIELAPALRARIHTRHDRRNRRISTSDVYATVVRQALEIDARDGLSALDDRDGEPVKESPRLWAFLHTLMDRAVGRANRRDRLEARVTKDLPVNGGLPAQAEEPETAATKAALRNAITRLLDEMEPVDRTLMMLRLKGVEWEHIATETGLRAESCRQRWHRLTEQLGKALDEHA